jgi:hypothetical protein
MEQFDFEKYETAKNQNYTVGDCMFDTFQIFFALVHRMNILHTLKKIKSIAVKIFVILYACLYAVCTFLSYQIVGSGLKNVTDDDQILFCVIVYNLLHFPLIHPITKTTMSIDTFSGETSKLCFDIESKKTSSGETTHKEKYVFECRAHWSHWAFFVIFNIFAIIYYSKCFGLQYDAFKYVLFFFNPIILVMFAIVCVFFAIFIGMMCDICGRINK